MLDYVTFGDSIPPIAIIAAGIIGFLIILKIMGKTFKLALTVLIIAFVLAAAYFLIFWNVPGNFSI